jgi:hypothetical protein
MLWYRDLDPAGILVLFAYPNQLVVEEHFKILVP